MTVRGLSLTALAILIAVTSAAAERKPRQHGQKKAELKKATEKLPPDAKQIEDANDVRYALYERECLEDRIHDYLERHGDLGVIDPEVLLETTRGVKEELDRDRPRFGVASIGGSVWTSIGPNNGSGRLTTVAPHPTTSTTAIVGAAGGGAWKTTDAGSSWAPLTETIANVSVGAISYAPSNANIVYLGTGEGGYAIDFIPGIGLLATADGGTNWNLPSSVIASMFYRISVRPTDANELVVGTNVGALRSTAGQNGPWTTVIASASAPAVTGYGDVTDIVRDPSNALVMYAATWDRNFWCQHSACGNPTNFNTPTILKSIDGGATWNPANSGFPVSTSTLRVNRISIAIAASNTQVLYAATSIFDNSTGIELSHVYKTINGGTSWTETNLASTSTSNINTTLGGQAWYDNAIAVAPADANIVLVGGVRYAKTIDGGTTWTIPTFTGGGVHVDVHDLRYDSGNTLWIANDGGIWTSPDNGNLASNHNTNLVTRQFYGLTIDPINRNRVYGGQQDNGTVFRSDAGGTTWSFFSGNDGFQTSIHEAATAVVFSTSQFGLVWRTLRGGNPTPLAADYSPDFPSAEAVPFFTLVKSDPNNPNLQYTGSYRLWKTTTGGEAWTPLPIITNDGSTFSTSSTIRAIAIAQSSSLIIMIAKGTNIFRSIDGGNTWSRVISGLPSKTVLGIEIDPADSSKAYAALAGQSGTSVYYTLNGGTSWTARGTGLPSFSAQVVRVDPTDSNTLYCGTDVGVYRSTDGGANWSRFGTGMPAVSIYDLQTTRDGSVLRAASHGRGMWELTVTGNTNNAPAGLISPGAPQTVAKGTPLTFTGTFSDPDGGDSATATWTFPDIWTTTPATNGASLQHQFNRAGRFPVTLAATDSHGAKGAMSVDITVTESGESCAVPIVISGVGPFPYTTSITTENSTKEGSDPSPVGSCYNFTPQAGIWFSFTPATSGTYYVSLCGSRVSAVVAGFTGAACGPHVSNGMCLANTSPSSDCSQDSFASFTGTSGQMVRFFVTNYFSNDYGPVSLTISNTNTFSPVVRGISPTEGTTAGGTLVAITGSGFTGSPTVSIGGTAATGVTVVSPSLITATTPAHSAGTVDVSVTTTATATASGAYIFSSPIVLTAPTNVVATAVGTTQIDVSWNAVAGADHYEVYRRATGGSFTLAGSPVGPTFSDTGRTPANAYLYRVRAMPAAGSPGPDSTIELATTVIFTNDPLAGGTTTIKGVHLIEIRAAVDAVRLLAGIGAGTYTDLSPAGVIIKSIHIIQLRSQLDAARAPLGLTALSYANSAAGSTPVRAADFTELRDGTK